MPFIGYTLLPHRNIAIPLIAALLLLTTNITVYRHYIRLLRLADLVTVTYSIIISTCLLHDLVATNSITYHIVYGITSPYYYCRYP